MWVVIVNLGTWEQRVYGLCSSYVEAAQWARANRYAAGEFHAQPVVAPKGDPQ